MIKSRAAANSSKSCARLICGKIVWPMDLLKGVRGRAVPASTELRGAHVYTGGVQVCVCVRVFDRRANCCLGACLFRCGDAGEQDVA